MGAILPSHCSRTVPRCRLTQGSAIFLTSLQKASMSAVGTWLRRGVTDVAQCVRNCACACELARPHCYKPTSYYIINKILFHSMAFLPWHLAFVPSRNGQHQKPSGVAPKMTKFQGCLHAMQHNLIAVKERIE